MMSACNADMPLATCDARDGDMAAPAADTTGAAAETALAISESAV